MISEGTMESTNPNLPHCGPFMILLELCRLVVQVAPHAKPRPLIRKNSVVNQVKFLGLAYTFVISNVQNLLCHTHSKRVG